MNSRIAFKKAHVKMAGKSKEGIYKIYLEYQAVLCIIPRKEMSKRNWIELKQALTSEVIQVNCKNKNKFKKH